MFCKVSNPFISSHCILFPSVPIIAISKLVYFFHASSSLIRWRKESDFTKNYSRCKFFLFISLTVADSTLSHLPVCPFILMTIYSKPSCQATTSALNHFLAVNFIPSYLLAKGFFQITFHQLNCKSPPLTHFIQQWPIHRVLPGSPHTCEQCSSSGSCAGEVLGWRVAQGSDFSIT